MTYIHTWFADFEAEDHTITHSDVATTDLPAILVKLQRAGAMDLDKCYRGHFRKMALQSLFVSSESDYLSILRAATIAHAKAQIIEAFCQPDVHITQLIDAIDDIDEAVNLLSERLLEWHPPELENITLSITNAPPPESRMGDPLVQEFTLSVERLHELRSDIAASIVREMQALAPNISNVAGELLGARLIAAAGGLEPLARMPSSRIQVMGASKALFRHLKYKSKPPKHGLIFQHPLVRGNPVRIRGKVARLLAAKIAIAARLDFYSKEIYPDLMPQLERRISELASFTRRS
ncbi:MAG: NOP58 family protein [Euryarchaeota archaeon]|nr:NOP58 family protein [Euryarchaeota archaeon]